MYTGLKHLHLLTVILFLLSLIIKTILLFRNKESFIAFKRKTKFPEMAVTIIFLLTGIVMITLKEGQFSNFLWIKIALIVVSIPVAIIAFKKQFKYLALIGTLLFFIVYGLAEMSAKKPYINTNMSNLEFEVELGSAQHGMVLYQNNCIVCHGKQGDKGLGGATNLQTSTLADKEVKEVILNGRKNMPSYQSVLNEQEVEALKCYLLTLRVEE